MMFGKWSQHTIFQRRKDGRIISIDVQYTPEERSNPEQEFEVVGFLSEMISLHYNALTAPEGAIDILSPDQQPDSLGVLIPSDYQGKTLPLWRVYGPLEKCP